MSFRIKKDNSDEVLEALALKIKLALELVGIAGENNAKFEITAQGAVDTGNLRNSLTHEVVGKDVYIGTNVEYAPYVEFGTSKMQERPYLRPAVKDNTNEYKTIIEEVLKS
jgi:HK97 gp10 family phage protein